MYPEQECVDSSIHPRLTAFEISRDVQKLKECHSAYGWNEREITLFTNPSPSDTLNEMIKFGKDLQMQCASKGADPHWFVTNLYGSRTGHGSIDLLKGAPMDSRSNPIYRYAIQYLDEQALLDRISNDEGDKNGNYDSIITSVSYLHTGHPHVNKSCLNFSQCTRLALISLDRESKLSIEGHEVGPMAHGEILVVSKFPDVVSGVLCTGGSFICTVFGEPSTKFRNNKAVTTLSKIELASLHYSNITTTARRFGHTYSNKICCPDCRRPIIVKPSRMEQKEVSAYSDKESHVLVTFATDASELQSVIEAGTYKMDKFSERVLLVSIDFPVTEKLQDAWTRIIPCPNISKWNQKRGIHDYSVPESHVSPALFSRTSTTPLKDSAYSIVSAIGHPELEGRLIYLVPPAGMPDNGVTVRASSTLFKKMKTELHDWSHPCHAVRVSALDFIREWIRAFPDIAR